MNTLTINHHGVIDAVIPGNADVGGSRGFGTGTESECLRWVSGTEKREAMW